MIANTHRLITRDKLITCFTGAICDEANLNLVVETARVDFYLEVALGIIFEVVICVLGVELIVKNLRF